MLKACWDCLAGDQQRQSEDRYSVHMNGGSYAPPWPSSNVQNVKMFLVPTELKKDDEIIISGNMIDGMLDIALGPDSNQFNIVSQINVVYPDNQSHDQITTRNVINGISSNVRDFIATEYFTDTKFDVRFIIIPDAIRISIGETFLENVPLAHHTNDIRVITVRGQVKELNFRFDAY